MVTCSFNLLVRAGLFNLFRFFSFQVLLQYIPIILAGVTFKTRNGGMITAKVLDM